MSQIPLDLLMIETDSPFLIPKDIRPRPAHNEPCYLGRVAEVVAACYKLPVAQIIEVTTRNALTLFSLEKNTDGK